MRVRGCVDCGLPHVHGAFAGDVVVEGHDVDRGHGGVVGRRALQDRLTVGVQAVLLHRQGVLDLQRDGVGRGPGLGQRDRLVAPGDAGGVVQRVGLDVEVQSGDPERGDHLLVVPGDRADAGARVGDLGAAVVGAVAAERRDHVAAESAQRGDVRTVVVQRHRRGAVPVQCAGPFLGGLQEGEGVVLRPGGLGGGRDARGVGRAR